jgi:hypothetical protein
MVSSEGRDCKHSKSYNKDAGSQLPGGGYESLEQSKLAIQSVKTFFVFDSIYSHTRFRLKLQVAIFRSSSIVPVSDHIIFFLPQSVAPTVAPNGLTNNASLMK